MKRFLFSILMVVIGLSAFSQSPSRFINLQPAYPVAIGESTVDNVSFSNNGLYMYDILQDSLPQYEIGRIFTQTVRYTEGGHGFYVKADSLHSLNVVYSYEINEPPQGTIEFNETTGRFKYYPTAEDYKSFVVTFSATNGIESVSEDVAFNLMPQTAPEKYAFQTQGVMPDATDYTIIAETSKPMFLNNEERTAYSISVSGKDLIFDDAVKNKVWGLNRRNDIYELNIFAERLVIRTSLSLPQTNVTIYTKELIFEDHDTVFASINTTPLPVKILANGHGVNGANAGNINLYVKAFKGNMAKRFILNGAKGQSANRNGAPGNGGNGGIVTSTIDLTDYCDFARGSGGVKFDVAEDGSYEAGAIVGSGNTGITGQFELTETPYAYLHPYYISAVMRYANDAFINNYTDYTLKICKEYRALIDEYMNSTEWESCNAEEEVELQKDLTEIDNMLFRLEQGLDYFGNSTGWVPLLSFEVMLTNYDDEIDRAIPTLYMYYWLSRIDQTLEHKIEASQFAASKKEQEIQKNQDLINSLVLEIPVIKDKCTEIESKINELTLQAEIIKNNLLSKAKRNVKKKNRINKAINICKNVINCIPVYGTAMNTAINVATNVAYATGLAENLLEVNDYGATSVFDTAGSVNYQNILNSLDAVIDTITWSNLGANANLLKDTYNSVNKSIAPLVSSINNINKLLTQSSTPQSEVETELSRLLAESIEYNQIVADIKDLNQQKLDLINRLIQVNKDIVNTVSKISNDVIALDVFRRDAFTGNSKRDLNAMLYLEEMEQRAKNRLLKYHYYLRKAYEYRLLKPYEGEFNLVGMFERFESLGMALDDVINEAAYASLGSIFREVISEMAEKIVDDYSANFPEQSAPITIVIPKEQLDIINTDESVALNFHEMGIFASDEENVRIVNLGIQHIETHIDGNVGYSGYMDLNMTHSGISQFRKDGQIYWFDHMSRTTTSPHTWGVRYDAVSNESTNIQPSAASASLLSSIIGNNNIMMFSRPSAWSNIVLTKKVHTSGDADIVIDSLVLRLQYDFIRRSNDIRNIDITANEGLLPYITCSEEDVNGRSNGNGNLYRSYRVGNQPVTFTAIDNYGTYHFVNWTDRSGKVVSNKRELTVYRSKDQFYTANYERRVPILNVPDTIKVGHTGGEYTIHVDNIGSGDIEMDWYVSDSLSTWVHLNEIAEGVDKGSFTFAFDSNTSGEYRVDSLEIFAPETDIMSKMIYITQVDGEYLNVENIVNGSINVKIHPNPMREYVIIEGECLQSINIYSLAGREICSYTVDDIDSFTINVSNLSNGMYIIKVKTKDGLLSKKMLKTR